MSLSLVNRAYYCIGNALARQLLYQNLYGTANLPIDQNDNKMSATVCSVPILMLICKPEMVVVAQFG